MVGTESQQLQSETADTNKTVLVLEGEVANAAAVSEKGVNAELSELERMRIQYVSAKCGLQMLKDQVPGITTQVDAAAGERHCADHESH